MKKQFLLQEVNIMKKAILICTCAAILTMSACSGGAGGDSSAASSKASSASSAPSSSKTGTVPWLTVNSGTTDNTQQSTEKVTGTTVSYEGISMLVPDGMKNITGVAATGEKYIKAYNADDNSISITIYAINDSDIEATKESWDNGHSAPVKDFKVGSTVWNGIDLDPQKSDIPSALLFAKIDGQTFAYHIFDIAYDSPTSLAVLESIHAG